MPTERVMRRSFLSRLLATSLVAFGITTIYGSYSAIRYYYAIKDVPGIGGSPSYFSQKLFIGWFSLGLSLAVVAGVFVYLYDLLTTKKYKVMLLLLTVTLPFTLLVATFLLWPPLYYDPGAVEMRPLMRYWPLTVGCPVLFFVNARAWYARYKGNQPQPGEGG